MGPGELGRESGSTSLKTLLENEGSSVEGGDNDKEVLDGLLETRSQSRVDGL